MHKRPFFWKKKPNFLGAYPSEGRLLFAIKEEADVIQGSGKPNQWNHVCLVAKVGKSQSALFVNGR